MKLSKDQLDQFESLLKSQGYKRDCSYKGDFCYYKTLIKEENFILYVMLEFYDFIKYERYSPKEFPISFQPKIVIIQDSMPTKLDIPFIYDKHPLFSYYDEDKKCFVEREWSKREVEKYLGTLESIATKFKNFYLENLQKFIIK